MTRNGIAEVLNLKRPLQTGGKEAAKRSDEGSERGEDEGVELNGCDGELRRDMGPCW